MTWDPGFSNFRQRCTMLRRLPAPDQGVQPEISPFSGKHPIQRAGDGAHDAGDAVIPRELALDIRKACCPAPRTCLKSAEKQLNRNADSHCRRSY